MPDIFDINPLDKFMCLLTGHNGSGKSVLIGSWLERGPIYFFDFDGRMAPVAKYYRDRGLKKGQLQYDTYGPTGDNNIYKALTKLNSFLHDCPYAAIAVDSFTAVTVSTVMYSLHKRQAKTAPNETPSFSKGELIIPDWDEYKGETVYVTMLLDLCKTLAAKGTAVFWTAHPIESTKIEKGTRPGEKDSYSRQTRYAAYGNKADSLIPIYFDEIYHLTTRYSFQEERALRYAWTQPREEINAKTALGLPSEIEWTDKSFYRVLQGLLNKEEEKPKDDVTKKEEIKKDGWF